MRRRLFVMIFLVMGVLVAVALWPDLLKQLVCFLVSAVNRLIDTIHNWFWRYQKLLTSLFLTLIIIYALLRRKILIRRARIFLRRAAWIIIALIILWAISDFQSFEYYLKSRAHLILSAVILFFLARWAWRRIRNLLK